MNVTSECQYAFLLPSSVTFGLPACVCLNSSGDCTVYMFVFEKNISVLAFESNTMFISIFFQSEMNIDMTINYLHK